MIKWLGALALGTNLDSDTAEDTGAADLVENLRNCPGLRDWQVRRFQNMTDSGWLDSRMRGMKPHGLALAHVFRAQMMLQANNTHSAFHSLLEAAVLSSKDRPNAAKVLSEAAATLSNGLEPELRCMLVLEALRLSRSGENNLRKSSDALLRSGLGGKIASVGLWLARERDVPFPSVILLSFLATEMGYPAPQCEDDESDRGLSGVIPQIPLWPLLRRAIRLNRDGDYLGCQEALASLMRIDQGPTDPPGATQHRRVLDAMRILISLREPAVAIQLVPNAANAAPRFEAVEETKKVLRSLLREITRRMSGTRLWAEAYTKSYLAYLLSRTKERDNLVECANLLYEANEYPGLENDRNLRDVVLWNLWFSQHNLGFYEASLGNLSAISLDNSTIGRGRLLWARLDTNHHLNFISSRADINEARNAAIADGDLYTIAQIDSIHARVHMENGSFLEAMARLQLSAEAYRRGGFMADLSNTLANMANLHNQQGNIELAEGLMLASFNIASSNGLEGAKARAGFEMCMMEYQKKGSTVAYDDVESALFFTLAIERGCNDPEYYFRRFVGAVYKRHPRESMQIALSVLVREVAHWATRSHTAFRFGLAKDLDVLRLWCLESGSLINAENMVFSLVSTGSSLIGVPRPSGRPVPESARSRILESISSWPNENNSQSSMRGDGRPDVESVTDEEHAAMVEINLVLDQVGVTPQRWIVTDELDRANPVADDNGRFSRTSGDQVYAGVLKTLEAPTVGLSGVIEKLAGRAWIWWSQWSCAGVWFDSVMTGDGRIHVSRRDGVEIAASLRELNEFTPLSMSGESRRSFRARMRRVLSEHPAIEQERMERLGRVLLPDILTAALNSRPGISLITCLDWRSRIVPIPLLIMPGSGSRLVNVARTILDCPSVDLVALVQERTTREVQGDGTFCLMDPGGARLVGASRVPTPPLGETDVVALRPDAPEWLHDRYERLGVARMVAPSTVSELRAELVNRGYSRLVFVGHAYSPGGWANPGRSALHVAPGETLDVATWINRPHYLPVPAEVALLACNSSGVGSREWLGLPMSAMLAGADRIICTRWPLLNHPGMWSASSKLVRSFDSIDFHCSVSEMQRRMVAEWDGEAKPSQDLHPVHWGGHMTVAGSV